MVRGQILTMRSSYVGLIGGLAFSILLVYLLIVVNFQSWLDPFIIISALPAALAGIAWFLFVTHTTLSVPALTGSIMCMGVATANSILVVSFAKEQLGEGKDALAAALEAGFTRFRPVLMTALAMMIGMVPMALGMGEGGEQNAPLDEPSLEDFCWRLYQRYFSFQRSLACCMGAGSDRRKRDKRQEVRPALRDLEKRRCQLNRKTWTRQSQCAVRQAENRQLRRIVRPNVG